MSKIAAWCSFLVCLLLWGCSADEWQKEINSGIRIRLVDFNVETKAAPQALQHPQAEQFKLEITNASTGGTVKECNYTEDVISLSTGTYDVKAMSGDNPVLALNEPYYEGVTENVRVTADENAKTVDISCKVANALVSVEFDNSKEKTFSSLYASYYVLVKVGDKEERIEDVSSGDTKSAYFRAGSTFEIYFCGQKKDDTEVKQIKLEGIPTTLEAAGHLILTLAPEQSKYELPLEISKAEVTSVTITETIPLEWLPKPKIGGFNEDGANTLEYTETADAIPAVLNFSGSSDIQDVEFSFAFADGQEKYQRLNSKTFTFSALTEEDKALLQTAGIEIPSWTDKSGSWNLTAMTANLQVASGSETSNKIKLRVKANNRWSSEEDAPAEFEIKTVAPEITVSAKPEDIWAKSLTVSGSEVKSGNPEKIQVTGYQYLDGAEWKDCTNGLAKLTNLPSDAKMQVRAVYREGVYAEPTEIVLETPAQLPNSDMEKWQVEELEGTIRTYYPWNSGETSFWNTNNDYTTRYRVWGSTAAYNCFPAVSYVSGRNGGKAAEIRNTASGRGNTNAWIGSITYNYNKVAGELFIGELSIDGNAYTINKGKEFTSRPTALHFYYKYAPHNNDTWKASIELLDENKNTIISQDVTASSSVGDFTDMTVSLNYEEGKTYAKCRYVCVIFSSTINTGSNLQYEKQTYYLQENGNSLKYSNALVGSVLTIDDISLVYDK